MGSEASLAAFRAAGLPADGLSGENALLIEAARGAAARALLVVDPSGAAAGWLRGALAGGPLEVADASEARAGAAAELAARFGKALLLHVADGAAPLVGAWLLPLLRRETRAEGGRRVVAVGDRAVEFAEGFRLVLSTRAAPSRAALPAAEAARLVIVNFTVTKAGLQGQLLGAAIAAVAPALEVSVARAMRRAPMRAASEASPDASGQRSEPRCERRAKRAPMQAQ